MTNIKKIYAREVLDSRGFPTVEVEVTCDCCIKASAIVPSGASTGEREAIELRDNDKKYYNGKGVLKAVDNVNKIIAPAILKSDLSVSQQQAIDKLMIDLDGTENKSKLGANAILGVSLAIAKAAAKKHHMPLYRYLGGVNAHILPTPMLNIINGGAHADNNIDFQEFMIVPGGAKSFRHAMQMASEIYHALKGILKKDGHSTGVGDEGGFAPNCDYVKQILDYMCEAVRMCGYKLGTSGANAVAFAIDGAVSELTINKKEPFKYIFKKHNKQFNQSQEYTSMDMINIWEDLRNKYPIISIEDGLDENDWKGFSDLTAKIGDRTQIVGDDLFVTNTKYIKKGIDCKAANSALIKLNQIGTISETISAVKLAQKRNWTTVISHRSGETEDTTIADLSVALNTGQIKTGSMARTERIAKYNQLLRIEEELGDRAVYQGFDAFYNLKSH